jgi:hypothetical protein
LRIHPALMSLIAVAGLSCLQPTCSAEAEGALLTHFLFEQELARAFLDKCSNILPDALREDFTVTYKSYVLTLTQAQRILENQGKDSHDVVRTPWLTEQAQQRAKKLTQDFVTTVTSGDPVRACQAYFQMFRREDDAVALARRTAEKLDRMDAEIDAHTKPPLPPVPM